MITKRKHELLRLPGVFGSIAKLSKMLGVPYRTAYSWVNGAMCPAPNRVPELDERIPGFAACFPSEERPTMRNGGPLRVARLDMGLTLKQVAEHFGLDISTAARIEKGEFARKHRARIARFLGVKP